MYCLWDSKCWQCPLCLHRNKIDKSFLNSRYATSISRSRCEECLYPTYVMDIPVSQMKYSKLGCITFRHPASYKENARELLVLVVDCTAFPAYLDYVKKVLKELVIHYRSCADICSFSSRVSLVVLFTSGGRLGVYNIKHSITKVLVVVVSLLNYSTRASPPRFLTWKKLEVTGAMPFRSAP